MRRASADIKFQFFRNLNSPFLLGVCNGKRASADIKNGHLPIFPSVICRCSLYSCNQEACNNDLVRGEKSENWKTSFPLFPPLLAGWKCRSRGKPGRFSPAPWKAQSGLPHSHRLFFVKLRVGYLVTFSGMSEKGAEAYRRQRGTPEG